MKIIRIQTAGHNTFNSNHLRPTRFNRYQQVLESGSGPGGRRFKSSLPDQSFQAHKQRFWFFVYTAVVDFVDGQSHRVQYAGDHTNRRTGLHAASRVRMSLPPPRSLKCREFCRLRSWKPRQIPANSRIFTFKLDRRKYSS